MYRLYQFKLVEDNTGTERVINAEAPTMQEAISKAYVSAHQWIRENSQRWQIVSAEDKTHTHKKLKEQALRR
jgi:hypothetical protein